MIGRTRIELTNVNTGKKEVIEHKNTITDGVVKHLISSGFFNNSPFSNWTWTNTQLWRRLVGGILLFQDTIQDDGEGNYPTVMPTGNKMIANGSYNVSNSSAITELGSWNTTESSATTDTITMVYDWTTAQGNGTISSVCLTSDVGGQIGYGNSTSDTSNSTYRRVLFENQNTNSSYLSNKYTGTSNPTYSVKNNVLYWFFSSSTASFSGATVTLNYRPIPISDVSIFDIAGTRTVTMPSSHSSGNKYIIPMPEAKFLILSTANIANNASGTFLVYDASTDTFTSLAYTNTTGYALNVTAGNIVCNNKYIAFINVGSNTKHIAIYTISTGAFSLIENAEYSSSSQTPVFITDDLLLSQDAQGWTKIIDIPASTSYRTNCGSVTDKGFNLGNNIIQVGDDGYYRNPLYLATVNNLDSPVTKTAAQTMKVTYTLTKA